jgi:hypothetical protein
MSRLATAEPHDTNSVASRARSAGRRIGIATIVGAAASGAFVVGGLLGLSHAGPYNHARGACIALEFAEAFGAIGTTQKRQTWRSLTSSAGRHHGLFPASVEELEDVCTRIWPSEARLGR